LDAPGYMLLVNTSQVSQDLGNHSSISLRKWFKAF